MNQKNTFICSCCGEEIDQWPALAYSSPSDYLQLSEEYKNNIGFLSSDFCVIEHPNQTDRFIRCTMTQKVNDSCQNLEYGLWVSLSEKSFKDYDANFDNENHETQYFGWLCNGIFPYKFNESVPTTVCTRKGNQRPEIIPHKDFNHPFVHDYYNGISIDEAERRIDHLTGIIKAKEVAKKKWWQFW